MANNFNFHGSLQFSDSVYYLQKKPFYKIQNAGVKMNSNTRNAGTTIAPGSRVHCSIIFLIFFSWIVSFSAIASNQYDGHNFIDVRFNEGTDPASSQAILSSDFHPGIKHVRPIFTLPDSTLMELNKNGNASRVHQLDKKTHELPDLRLWFRVALEENVDHDAILEEIQSLRQVDIAEISLPPAPPPHETPDFTGSQSYLHGATEDGINASYAWVFPGGNGEGIKIYDIEYSWNSTHEDLVSIHENFYLMDAGNSLLDPFDDSSHGTAVLGVLAADPDSKGVTGMVWGAETVMAPAMTTNLFYNPENAIMLAVNSGMPGDVILIEQQTWVCNTDHYGPLEYRSPTFDAIRYAVTNGFVVVQAAGNGGFNLDDPACMGLFNRSVRDSGAIIVGAGSYRRARKSSSSYGSRVDMQARGNSITTTGYGSSYRKEDDPHNPDFWYTDSFGGTSAASALVAGAVANLQSFSKQWYGRPFTAKQVRDLLVFTGRLQTGDISQHIGPMPDVKSAIDHLRPRKPGYKQPRTPSDHPQPRAFSRSAG